VSIAVGGTELAGGRFAGNGIGISLHFFAGWQSEGSEIFFGGFGYDSWLD